MFLIEDKQSYDTNCELIQQFSLIYEEAFPDENEREELSSIYNRLDANSTPFTFLIFDVIDNNVQGGLVVDVYTASEIAHLIYIVTNPKLRHQGVAKKLLKSYLPKVLEKINKQFSINIENVVFESNNPELTQIDSFDAKLRLDIFRKLGAKHIPITYIQPPLEGRSERVDNLFLFVYTQHNYIDSQKLIKFIGQLYYGLGIHNYESDEDYITMIESIELSAINSKIQIL
jgi:hypothetical protein